jgi:hypothetical protein
MSEFVPDYPLYPPPLHNFKNWGAPQKGGGQRQWFRGTNSFTLREIGGSFARLIAHTHPLPAHSGRSDSTGSTVIARRDAIRRPEMDT